MGEVLGSTHSEFTPVQISHKSDMKRPEPRQDVEGAVERLESVMRYNSSYGPVLVHADHDLRALLTDWRQRGEEIERLRGALENARDSLNYWQEAEGMDLRNEIADCNAALGD